MMPMEPRSPRSTLRGQAYLKDKTVSLFTSVKNNFNENINLEFSEPVFSTANGNGTSQHQILRDVSGGTATLAQNTPTSVSEKVQNTPTNPTESRLTQGQVFNGNANGEEKIKVSPADSIYDVHGNAMATSQTLEKSRLPKRRS